MADDSEPNGLSSSERQSGSDQGLVSRVGVLALVQVILGAILIPIAYFGGANLGMAVGAWGVCFVATIAGHIASEFPKGNEFVMLRLAAGMACRTLLPMGFAIWGLKFCKPRIEASVVLVLALAYLGGLAADSYLSLMRTKRDAESQGGH